MLYFTIGVAGFFSVMLYDVAQIHGRKGIATALSSIGYLGISASIIFLMVRLPVPNAPLPLFLTEVVLAGFCLMLLIYTVLIEIPLNVRRSKNPVGNERHPGGRPVVSTGFYGMVRHPGFLWFLLLWVAIDAIYRCPLVTLIGAGLVATDLLLVVLEDLIFFPRIFSDYAEYKEQVPFIIPHLRRK